MKPRIRHDTCFVARQSAISRFDTVSQHSVSFRIALFGLGRYEDALRGLDRALAPGLASARAMRDSTLSRLRRAGDR